MHTVSPLHPALPALFDLTLPNRPALWAVLEGRYDGLALVDSPDQPTQCVVRTNAALTYASRSISQSFLDQAIASARQIGSVWLVWSPDTELDLPAKNATVIPRVAFTRPDLASVTDAARPDRLPVGFAVRPIDRDLLQRCLWREEMAFYAGNQDNFLRHGLGLCLFVNEALVSEAYASAIGGGVAEIGAITHPAHRGRGHAPLLCAHLIDRCAQRGIVTTWTCDADNAASIRVARKLGYQQETAYSILELERWSAAVVSTGATRP